jgi:hypothetical protein
MATFLPRKGIPLAFNVAEQSDYTAAVVIRICHSVISDFGIRYSDAALKQENNRVSLVLGH